MEKYADEEDGGQVSEIELRDQRGDGFPGYAESFVEAYFAWGDGSKLGGRGSEVENGEECGRGDDRADWGDGRIEHSEYKPSENDFFE